ncbi:transposable element Tc1 transposase [Trichonephila clavipes]|nr:transposable element Tc1 transposase [Trichonephila clavipes]
MFSDKSCFQRCPDDHRVRVWRSPGQRADPAFTIARQTGPQPGVIVWGTISFDSRTPLVVIRAHLQHSGIR